MKLFYTQEAIEDLIRLRKFIEEKTPDAAKRTANALLKGINNLKDFPYIGMAVKRAPNPELLRDLVIENNIVRYLVLDKTITILRVWHQKEDIEDR